MADYKKFFVIFLVMIIIAGFILYKFHRRVRIDFINADTIISGDYIVKANERMIIRNNATLIVNGDFKIEGELVCEGGSLILTVNGDLNVFNKIVCERPEKTFAQEIEEAGNGILIAVRGIINFEKTSEIVSNGNIQIVDNPEVFLETKESVEEVYQEISKDAGHGQRLGPIIFQELGEEAGKNDFVETGPGQGLDADLDVEARIIKISGKLIAKGVKGQESSVVLFNFKNTDRLILHDLEVIGSDGLVGPSDKENNCEAKGEDGLAGSRFLAQAPEIIINNFSLKLGNGGKGGDAETKKDCEFGQANGGNGGEPGNFKILALDKFDILGPFLVYPGKSGDGGDAVAWGKNGQTKENVGNAQAKGGDAKDNKGYLMIAGTISGINNILVGSIIGGAGGNAIANSGNGGDGEECQNGGNGGNVWAIGGKGGGAFIFLHNNIGRISEAEDLPGKGGDVWARGGKGGDGGDCLNSFSGGKGGNGGNVNAAAGKAGAGPENNGIEGLILESSGGNGGDGGDGCPEGFGGKGGEGNPLGQTGANGKNICQIK